jgi:hypothetical protein
MRADTISVLTRGASPHGIPNDATNIPVGQQLIHFLANGLAFLDLNVGFAPVSYQTLSV